jgi:hypothetical protein
MALPLRKLDRTAVEDIAVGATVLGTGGGGDPFIGKLMAVDAIEECGSVTLLDPREVPGDALVLPTAMMGAPTVLIEKIPKGDEAVQVVAIAERRLGKKAYATMSVEAGGVNSTIPIVVAARLGIPLVDCDMMGRAFPELQMVTPTLFGISATPMAMADEKGNVVLLETVDNLWTERLSRAATVVMGGTATIGLFPMTGEQVRQATIHSSISLIERIGHTVRDARAAGRHPAEAIVSLVHGSELFRGKVLDVLRRTVSGFARGEARVEGLEAYSGHHLLLRFQNENLIAFRDGDVVASVPDLITVLDLESGLPITTETLRYGNRVIVVGLPCDAKWRTPEGLRLVGPAYFGYDIDYKPLEQRRQR